MLPEANLFTFLSTGNSVDRAFKIYLSRWLLFTQLALIVVLPQIALSVTLSKSLVVDDMASTASEGTQDVLQPMSSQQMLTLVTEISVSYLFSIIIQAAIVQVVAEFYTQTNSTLKSSLYLAFDRFCAIFGFGLLYSAVFLLFSFTVGVPVGMLYFNQHHFFAILIGIVALGFVTYVFLSLTIVLPILVVEKQSPIGAIKRSFELVPGYRCYIFCSICLLVVVAIFGSSIYQGLITAIFGTSVLSTVLKGLAGAITLPLQTM